MKEVVIDQKLQSKVNLLIENTLEEEKKMEEDLALLFNNKASQQKKKKKKEKIRDEKNETVQHDTNKIMKIFD